MAEGNNLVVNSGKFRIARLSELSAEYYLDTSGSTFGAVLTYERESAILLSCVIRPSNIFTWNTTAQKVADLKDIKESEGGTDPSCFVQYVNRPQCLVVYTDGQISEYAMDRFRDAMLDKLKDVPVIIGFAVSSFAISVEQLETTINMSIPETFLSLSNDVMILVTAQAKHHMLMAKGCFNNLRTIPLERSTLLSQLPPFEPNQLKDINFTATPANLLKLQNVVGYVDLQVLYDVEDIPVEVLESLSDRTVIPRL